MSITTSDGGARIPQVPSAWRARDVPAHCTWDLCPWLPPSARAAATRWWPGSTTWAGPAMSPESSAPLEDSAASSRPLLMGYVYGRMESYALGLVLLSATAAFALPLMLTIVRRTSVRS